MFTGIVEEVGIVKAFNKDAKGASLEIECKTVLEDTKIGDSIAINGVCQTVTELTPVGFGAKVSEETLYVTNFNSLMPGDKVNLERALTLNSRLGGHIVSGHVDCKGILLSTEKLAEFYNLEFEVPQEQKKYIIHKGSITINGISLTVANISDNKFKIAIIPHTFNNTNLKYLKIEDYVNIETDILGKYIEKFLSANDNKSNISMSFLQENGFV